MDDADEKSREEDLLTLYEMIHVARNSLPDYTFYRKYCSDSPGKCSSIFSLL